MKKIVILFLLVSAISFAQYDSLNVAFRSHFPYAAPHECANICGYVDSTGKEYALVGVDSGMSIVNVTNPSAPFQVKWIAWGVQNSNSLWKEIKVYKKYAYVVSEAGLGVQIVDLSRLPATILPTKYFIDTVFGQQLNTIHSLHIDTTKGNLYVYGCNISSKGAHIISLANPWNPHYLGMFDNTYVHDGYVDNDTLYACEIYDGNMEVIDCRIKTAPVVLATVQTPLRFTHNSWLTPDKKTVLTTDEKAYSYLASYDISNMANITLLDTISGLSQGSIVHNTHIRKDYFAVTSWYRDGFSIVDCSRPGNLIRTGYYDMYAGSGNGFNGTWGVYPFLPSGTILCSNIEDGLYVFTPTYVRACYLEGNVKDSISLANLQGVSVTIISMANGNTLSDVSGNYATGGATAGNYSVQFSKMGYQTRIINGVNLQHGVVKILNTKLLPNGFGISQILNDQSFFKVSSVIFNDKVTLNWWLSNNENTGAVIRVFDYTGNLIETKKTDFQSGELTFGEEWPAGAYLVSLNSCKPQRVVKVK